MLRLSGWRWNARRLVAVMVGVFGCLFEFVAGLIEQILGLGRMTVHVPLVGLLSRGDSAICLINQPLRSREIGVSSGANIVFGLRKGVSADDKTSGQDRAKNDGADFHRNYLRQLPYTERPTGAS